MDDREPTAWQEINPARGLVARPEPRSELSRTLNDRLKPAKPDQFQAELTACLSLVGAAGMTEDDRCEWLKAARLTLEGIPADLLAQGCAKARRTCDHPSKVVPAIMADVEQQWKYRREHRVEQAPATTVIPHERRIERGMTPAEIEEFNEIMSRIGGATRYHPDGTRFTVDTPAAKAETRGPLRKPTRADYIALGVDPSVLDSIESTGGA